MTVQSRKRRWFIGSIIFAAVGLLAIAWVINNRATPEQRGYLPKRLAGTSKVVIRRDQKVGGETLAIITDRAQVAEMVKATRVTFIDSPCACFGFIDVEYHLSDGEVFTLNYKNDLLDRYIKYKNPWHVQASPSLAFSGLVGRHVRERTGM